MLPASERQAHPEMYTIKRKDIISSSEAAHK